MLMNHKIFLSVTLASLSLLSSCEKEAAFVFNEGEGLLDCENMTVEYNNGTRATVNPDDFTVYFVNSNGEAQKQYKYSELPSMVSLTAGFYKVIADFGENPDGAFESETNFGYYKGETSTSFEIKASEINQLPQTNVACSLNNIRIRVNVDEYCYEALSDVSVVVNVGTTPLTFNREDNKKCAYFKYVPESNSITATLNYTLDGVKKSETITYTPGEGKTFVATFTANKPENNDPGSIGPGSSEDPDSDGTITIDSSITLDTSITGTATDIDKPLDEVLKDDLRD